MFKRITSHLTSWRSDERGNIAMLFALMLIPMFGVMGGAIDYARYYKVQTELQYIVDTGAMAALNEFGKSGDAAKAQEKLSSYIAAALQDKNKTLASGEEQPSGNAVVLTGGTLNTSDSSLNPTLTASVEPVILGIVGVEKIDVSASTSAALASGNEAGTKALELSLVLDLSGSMDGDKVEDMKEAAQDFLNIVMPDDLMVQNRRVGLVPFANKVNVGSYAQAATNLNPTYSVTANTGRKIFSTTSFSWKSKSSCRTEVKKVFTSYSNSQAESYCANNFQSQGSGGSLQYRTPAVINETATTNYLLRTCVTERQGDQAYTEAAPGAGAYVGSASPTSGLSSQYTVDGKCLSNDTELPAIRPLTTEKESLQTYIAGFHTHTGTAGHLATAWAWYMLSPMWNTFWGPTVEDVVPYTDTETVKAAVIMTDGAYNSEYAADSATTQAYNLCQAMKTAGITVYTIGFDMNNEPEESRQLLRDCASPGKYYFPYDGNALRQAFTEIGNSLVNIVTRSSEDRTVLIKQ